MKRLPILLLVLLLFVLLLLFWWFFVRRPGEARDPIVLTDAAGAEVSEFQLHDSLIVDVVGLEPRAGYELEIVTADGQQVIANRLSTDQQGRIPATVLWYAIGSRPCWEEATTLGESLAYSRVTDATYAGQTYTLNVSQNAEVVRSIEFRVAAEMLRPTLYAADSRGCPKSGFLIGEEDVWVVGRNFPAGSLLRLWAVPASADWGDGDPLADQTGQHGYDLPPLIELGAAETHFTRLLWPLGLTSLGSYDIVAEVVAYPFGAYRAAPAAEASNVVASRTHSGFVVQRRPGVAEPLEVEIAGSTSSPFTFRSTFLTTENVYVGVDPVLQPSFVGKTADVYIVDDKTDAQWTTDKTLTDKTGGVIETITVNGICGNCWKTLAWTAPLTVGKYDVVLDFNQDGLYTPGTDLIDALDPVGFVVSEVRVDEISFNYSGSGAVTLYDEAAGGNVSAPEYVSAGQVLEPAAWVKGGSHAVKVRFKAVPGLSQAKVWAEGGLGGLASTASPVTVTFSGGNGQGTFTVNSPPAAVARTEIVWNFKYKNGATVDMGSTGKHLLYTLVAAPQAPQSPPWVGALEVAATVASGETTAAGAARKIWSDFYLNAGGQYDTVGGAPAYTGKKTAGFNLTKWLTNYRTGSVGTVNCYDMGKAVVVFANALGCGAEYTLSDPFGYLNLVKPIGKGWTNNPFYDGGWGCSSSPVVNGDWDSSQGRCDFGNHAFTRLAGQILDASGGRVDTDGDPDGLPAGSPWDLDGSDSWLASYRDKVVDDVPASSPATPTVYSFGVY